MISSSLYLAENGYGRASARVMLLCILLVMTSCWYHFNNQTSSSPPIPST
ncbi:hypothetical protein ACE38W_06480 [Chitinophaga sp. Hz27]